MLNEILTVKVTELPKAHVIVLVELCVLQSLFRGRIGIANGLEGVIAWPVATINIQTP